MRASVGLILIRDSAGIYAYQINPMHPYNIATQCQANRMCSTGVVIASLALFPRLFLGLAPGDLAPRRLFAHDATSGRQLDHLRVSGEDRGPCGALVAYSALQECGDSTSEPTSVDWHAFGMARIRTRPLAV